LGVANKFRSDTAELQQGVRNANDGISTLQIIDGGLNNVSKMLDRLKTLATQSASSTFTGDRATMNTEYQALLTEIDRQASNVGLSTGAHGGRYNTNISVYVGGGGAAQGNSKIGIDFSGAANRIDAGGLGLSGTSIAGGAATAMGAKQINTGTFLTSASQTFTFNISKAGQASFTTAVTVTGDASGLTGDQGVAQLNAALNSHGISASINSASGVLQFSGDIAFTAQASNAATGIATGNATITNGALYRLAGQGTYNATQAGATKYDVTVGSQTATVTVAEDASLETTLQQLNTAFRPLGVYAVKDADGDNIEFQSLASFGLTADAANGEAIFAATGSQNANVTGPSTTASATSAAESAIQAVTTAVARLGSVQGKVGTAQNKLQYAVILAQSQISNFSAAESRIRDADVAAEAANLTKAQVLQQASLAAMAQANSAPQAVLSLLRG
jgi:flagellin